MKKKTLGLFFTKNVSLREWKEIGILEREIKLLKEILNETEIGKIIIFSYGGNSELEYKSSIPEGMEVVVNSFNIPGSIYAILMPFIHIKTIIQTDVTRTIQLRGSLPAVITKLLFGKRTVLRCGFQLSRNLRQTGRYFKYILYSVLERIVFQVVDMVIVTDDSSKLYIRDNYNIDEAKIVVIPNYIDTELFAPLPDVEKTEDEVCYVGRLAEIKNLYNLINATDLFGGSLKIIGSGKLEKNLREYSSRKNVNVKFIGKMDNTEISVELNKSEYFVLPSFSEGQPKSLLEAMSCGLPVVGTDVPGIKNIIRDEENGVLCGTDSDSIARALKLLKDDRELREKISKRAREYVKQNYSLKRVIEMERDERLLG